MVIRAACLTFMLVCGMTALARAGPPYETDDPEPTEYRNYEIYAFSEVRASTDESDGTPFALEINYGVLPNVQFSVSLPTAFASDDAGSRMAGGDDEIGVKYRFVQETRTRPQISFYPSVTLASGPAGLGAGRGTLLLPVWMQKTVGKYTIFGGGGVLFDGAAPGGHTWLGGVAVTRDISQSTNIGLEIYHSGTQEDAEATTDIGVGWIHSLGEVHALLFSAAASINNSSVHAYGAYEWRLGPR